MIRRLVVAAAVLGAFAGGAAVTSAAPRLAPTTAVRFPAGFRTPIYVGETQVWPTTVPSTSTTTTAPASTSTTAEPTTTSAPGSTSTSTSTVPPATTAATTSTTSPSTGGPGCGLTEAAFCETFDHAYPDSVSRTGDLDETVWGVSRAHNQGNVDAAYQWYNPAVASIPGCQLGVAPNDVRVCAGRLIEGVNDGGNDSKTVLAMYPKQPFNWAGRTGTIVFDASLNSHGNHSAWPELWVTDKPVPAPGVDGNSTPFNGFGINFDGQAGNPRLPGRMILVKDGVRTEYDGTPNWGGFPDIAGSNADSPALNHVRITVSRDEVKAYVTQPGGTEEFLVTTWSNLDLQLEQGLVWMNDGHYNGCKDGDTQCIHAFAWDNFGFDGPKTYRDLSFDALDRMQPRGDGGVNLGWDAMDRPVVEVKGVHTGDKQATAAYALFNSYSIGSQQYAQVSLNGGPMISTPWPAVQGAYTIYTLAVPIPLEQIYTDGRVNTLTFYANDHVNVANVNIVLVNAQTVP